MFTALSIKKQRRKQTHTNPSKVRHVQTKAVHLKHVWPREAKTKLRGKSSNFNMSKGSPSKPLNFLWVSYSDVSTVPHSRISFVALGPAPHTINKHSRCKLHCIKTKDMATCNFDVLEKVDLCWEGDRGSEIAQRLGRGLHSTQHQPQPQGDSHNFSRQEETSPAL